MARTTGRSGFKMRSGNTSTFKMMGSSPMRQETKKKTNFSEEYDKQQNIADPNADTWAGSGKPKTYLSLQADGKYKKVVNPSGSQSKSLEDLRDTHVTVEQDIINKEQDVQDIVTAINMEQSKGKKKKKTKKYKKQEEPSWEDAPVSIEATPTDEYLAYQESLKPGGANYKGERKTRARE